MKSEPDEWSWKQQVKAGARGVEWGGVRNFQAAKNLKKMKIGDKCFFYHTGKEKKIVGIIEIIKEHFLDKTDKTHKFVAVAVKALIPFKREVKLKEVKKNRDFADLALVKQSRLSVMKIDLKSWKKICKMGKIYPLG